MISLFGLLLWESNIDIGNLTMYQDIDYVILSNPCNMSRGKQQPSAFAIIEEETVTERG